jgi:TATA-binding protein-associated factor Taf7
LQIEISREEEEDDDDDEEENLKQEEKKKSSPEDDEKRRQQEHILPFLALVFYVYRRTIELNRMTMKIELVGGLVSWLLPFSSF